MNKYNVKSDKGTLVPDWIVEKMLDEQVKQGNPRNIKVFEDYPYSNIDRGGFSWKDTVLGYRYWYDIIIDGVYPPKLLTDVDELVEKVSNVIRDTLTNSFVLPERWCIKGTNPDECMAINAYARSLQGGDHWGDEKNNAKYFYLCIKDGKYYKREYYINGTLITFEQFQKYVLGVEFTLPKLWGVKLTEQNIDIVTGWRGATKNPSGGNLTGSRFYGDYILNKEPKGKLTAYCVNSLPEGYTEITYRQFLQYVLKSSSPNFVKLPTVVKQHLIEKSPKYKVGDWVIVDDSWLNKYGLAKYSGVAIQVIESTKYTPKNWINVNIPHNSEGGLNTNPEYLSLATKSEIEETLLIEAKNRYPKGIKFNSVTYKSATYKSKHTSSGDFRVVLHPDPMNIVVYCIINMCGKGVYKNGKWAEIIANTEPDITINGYKAEFFDDYVKFGCAKIDKQLFIALYKTTKINYSVYGNKNVEAVTIGKGTFSKEQIKAIAEYYENK